MLHDYFHIFNQSYHNCLDKVEVVYLKIMVPNLNEYFLLLEKGNLTERLLCWENVKNWKSKRTSVELYTRFLDDQFLQTKIVTSMQPAHFRFSIAFFSFPFFFPETQTFSEVDDQDFVIPCHVIRLI